MTRTKKGERQIPDFSALWLGIGSYIQTEKRERDEADAEKQNKTGKNAGLGRGQGRGNGRGQNSKNKDPGFIPDSSSEPPFHELEVDEVSNLAGLECM